MKAHFFILTLKKGEIIIMTNPNTPYASKCIGALSFGSEEEKVPIHLKMTLTIKEAAEYSNIGINKIDTLLKQPNCPFVLFVGTRKLVKRREFEEFISREIII